MSMDDRDGKIWMDGELVDWRDANVHILTHALHYAWSVTLGTLTTSTAWAYDTNANDRRLATITNSGVTRNFTLSALIAGGGGAKNPYDIQSIVDTAATTHPWLSQTHSYGYDNADRLLTANQSTPGNYTYAYDKLDNATSVTNPGAAAVTPTYNGLNQLATWGAKTYAYDANGNTLSGDGSKTYKWDAEGRLVQIDYVGLAPKKTQFSYDGLGRRTVMVETPQTGSAVTTRYQWCGGRICTKRSGTDTVTARYYPEGEYIASGTKKYVYQTDQLGSVRDVMDASTATRVAAIDYGPYGNRARTNGTVTPGYQYAGLFYHATSGLMLSATRALDTGTGRWLNRDPIREAGGVNVYGYVGGNPIMRVDPDGRNPIVMGAIVGTIAVIHYTRNYWNQSITFPNARDNWDEMKPEKSIWHRMGSGNEDNRKFVSRGDGGHSEAIFSKNGCPVAEDRNMATYNFFGPAYASGIPHAIFDVVPYMIFGNSPADHMTLDRFLAPFEFFQGLTPESERRLTPAP